MPASLHASPLDALALAAAPARLSHFDLALVAVYLVAITLFGLRFREKKGAAAPDKSLKSYFLANNTIPWWAIALSIVSAETSTLTIISIPGVAFAGNFGFLQLVIGYMLGRIVVAMLFLPRYFAGEMLTAYQLIDRRFGPVLHKVTAGLFLLTRAAAEGVRVFAVSIVVGIAIGTKDVLSIAIISALTLLYTFEGGMTAVIWTDVVQMFIYVGGTVVAIITLGSHVDGGWHTIHAIAGAAGKFHMLDFTLNLTSTYTFWAGILGGTFLTMASHGTDQLMVQRMLAARNLRESRLALLSSGAVIFLQFTLFLLIGAGLYVFYAQHPATFASSDRIFPTFIVREMPMGVAGLLVAAILAAAMSNLSAALNSLSSTTVVDFYMRLRPAADARERAIISKSSTVLWALVLFAIAAATVKVGGKGHVVEIGLSIASVAYGCLLGVFLLGTLTRYATEVGASIGMVVGFALNLWLWQGVFPVHIGLLTIPKVAYPWYTLIGAGVTFAVGSLASLVFRRQSRNTTVRIAALLLFAVILSAAKDHRLLHAQTHLPSSATKQAPPQQPDFAAVSTLINDAIAAHKLPGAVVLIGHNGQVVFHQAYGNRKLAGEPGLDGKPSPAEPMTEDTIFDMASLTKCLATATAVMQLYEQGKITSFDDPVQKYLPDFNVTQDPERAKVTVRMLLTHFSGEAPDVKLSDAWGLGDPDRAEGIHRALTAPLKAAPGSVFTYSDINFILLGALIEKLSGQREDDYVGEHLYKPLGMTETRYLPVGETCGDQNRVPFAAADETIRIRQARGKEAGMVPCTGRLWNAAKLVPRIAPTAHDDESKTNPALNVDFDQLLRGTVHDPTTRRMGGVAGHAGLFSTAHDVSLFAQALLDKLTRNNGPFPLKQSTLQLMTQPEQPGHTGTQVAEANAANAMASRPERSGAEKPAAATLPGLAAAYPAIKDHNLRGFGWDIDTAFSKPRGAIFPIGSLGHTGFTGTSLWMDPASNTYVVLLANAIHPRGGPPISNLRGQVATAAAQAIANSEDPLHRRLSDAEERKRRNALKSELAPEYERRPEPLHTLTGIDVLQATNFAALKNLHRFGLLTNQSGIDAQGHRTVDILHALTTDNAQLTTLFSPEHGIFGKQDTTSISAETDAATGLHVTSLYGAKDEQRRPSHEQLKDLDAVLIDLQDMGVHFWTYETVLGYFLEAAARESNEFHHELEVVVLDRPNLIGGGPPQGPVSDPGLESYTNYMPMPVRSGLTFGELARYMNGEAKPSTHSLGILGSEATPGADRPHATHTPPMAVDAQGNITRTARPATAQAKGLGAHLTVVPLQGWARDEYFDQTGLPWVNPSPNMRSLTAATLYPGVAFLEVTNISVGRGSTADAPFEVFGAGLPSKDAKTGEQRPAWFKGADVAAALNARRIPGVSFTAVKTPIAEDSNRYPYHGQTIESVRITLTDRTALDAPELGIEIVSVLHRLYPTQFQYEKSMRLIDNQSTLDALRRGDDPRDIAGTWKPALARFSAARQPYLLY